MGNRNIKEKRQADNQVVEPSLEEEKWQPPPRSECTDEPAIPWRLDVRSGAVIIMVQRFHNEDWDFVHYSVTLKYKDQEIARIDTEHSEVHRHQFYNNPNWNADRAHISWVRSQQDIEDTYQSSVEDLAEHAEDYLRRWNYGT